MRQPHISVGLQTARESQTKSQQSFLSIATVNSLHCRYTSTPVSFFAIPFLVGALGEASTGFVKTGAPIPKRI